MATTRELLNNKAEEVFSSVDGEKGLLTYYMRSRRKQKLGSKWIRGCSVALMGLGGIFPLLSKFENLKYISDLGYVCIALAGTALFFDKYFGFSSGWIRSITTSMEIEKQLRAVRFRWSIEMAKLDNCDPDQSKLTCDKMVELLTMLKDFVGQVDELTKQETQSWAAEFQSNTAELMKMANQKADEMKPGSVKVTIKNTINATGLNIRLDGGDSLAPNGTEVLFNNISPGSYIVTLSGELGGVKKSQTAVVTVESGKIAAVEIELK